MKLFISASLILATISLILPNPSYAHVTVSPKEAKTGERVNFSVSVPPEKDLPTTQIRLIIPEGVTSVRPNVKPGWDINLIKSGEGESAIISEIIWQNGSIAPDLRDEFVFRAMLPKTPTTLAWKAYQTYSDGSVVAWDLDPATESDSHSSTPNDYSESGPYSTTTVIDDLTKTHSNNNPSQFTDLNLPTILSIIAITFSGLALFKTLNPKTQLKK